MVAVASHLAFGEYCDLGSVTHAWSLMAGGFDLDFATLALLGVEELVEELDLEVGHYSVEYRTTGTNLPLFLAIGGFYGSHR